MPCRQTKFVADALELAREMLTLADGAEAGDVDDGCVLLCGILRDCAYQVKRRAETEMQGMQVMNRWDSSVVTDAAATGGTTSGQGQNREVRYA